MLGVLEPSKWINRTQCHPLKGWPVVSLLLWPIAYAATAHAQPMPEALRRPVGSPPRVVAGEALAEVRAFSVARSGDRALLGYLQAGTGRERGALRLASFRMTPAGALERTEPDRTLAPAASALALQWDATAGGAVVWVAPKPHRNESERVRHARHQDGTRSANDSLANPLGTPSLTAGDIVFQRVDNAGVLQGRPLTVFGENARAFRVAILRTNQGWTLAWTGAKTREGEVRGTVRVARVDTQGALLGAVSETQFSGPVGDSLRVYTATGTAASAPAGSGTNINPSVWVAWIGEHCRERSDLPQAPASTTDPSALIETRPRFMIQQGPLHEHPGAPITCDPLSLYTSIITPDGTIGAFARQSPVARDVLAVHNGALIASISDAPQRATLRALTISNENRSTMGAVWVPSGELQPPVAIVENGAALPVIAATASGDPQPSRIAPTLPPTTLQSLRAPVTLEVTENADHSVLIAALSRTHTRVHFGRRAANATTVTSSAIATPESVFDLQFANGDAPWLFARLGIGLGGPLLFLLPRADAPSAAEELVWTGDERFRLHLLRSRAARAAYMDLDHTYGPVSARPDAATNPSMPGLTQAMRRLRSRWIEPCDALQGRARYLVRHGVSRDIEVLAREQCEIPFEPGTPEATAAAAAAMRAP